MSRTLASCAGRLRAIGERAYAVCRRASRGARIATAAAYGGAAVGGGRRRCSARAASALIFGESKLARRAHPAGRRPRHRSSHDTTWAAAGVSRQPAADPGRDARRLDRRRLRRAPRPRHPGRPAGHRHLGHRPAAGAHHATSPWSGPSPASCAEQVDAAGPRTPRLAVIMIGANDVTHRVQPAEAVPHLAEAVADLRALGAEVVVGTCPDLGTIRADRPAAALLARRLSRQLAAAQTIAVVAGRRPHGVAGRPARPAVRDAAGAVHRRPVPPVGGRLRRGGRGAAAVGAGRARPAAPGPARPARSPPGARSRWPRPPPRRRPARAPRWPAPTGDGGRRACAAGPGPAAPPARPHAGAVLARDGHAGRRRRTLSHAGGPSAAACRELRRASIAT